MSKKPKMKIVVNYGAVGRILKSDEMGNAIEAIASGAARRCGDGYEFDRVILNTRVVSSVYTEEPEAIQDNLENNTILRNLR